MMGWPNTGPICSRPTLDIPAATDRGIGQFRIFKTGAKGTVGVDDVRSFPPAAALVQNFPNPFNPITNITVQNPARGVVTINIYDPLGRRVAMLYEGVLEPGEHRFRWDASEFASTLYVVKMSTEHYFTRKYSSPGEWC
jgi:hypothetical protein